MKDGKGNQDFPCARQNDIVSLSAHTRLARIVLETRLGLEDVVNS